LLNGKVPRLKKITADSGYKLAFKEHVETNYAWQVEVMQKPESTTGFVPQKGRWQVERYFGWPIRRRSDLDEDCSETWKKQYFRQKQWYKLHLYL
jgi:hypothetical protein